MDEIEQRKTIIEEKSYSFFHTKAWDVIIKIMRILTFIGIILILYFLITEIESVKMFANDPCRICLDKLGDDGIQKLCYYDPLEYLTGG